MTDAEYFEFADRALSRIPGWLATPAGHFTISLIAEQARRGVEGGIAELGVFRGKYLALLYRATVSSPRPVLGVDLFPDVAPGPALDEARQAIVDAVAEACGESRRLTMVQADTLGLTAADVASRLGGAAAFLSVDAGHEPENLFHDLGLAADLLAPGGIAAVDDAFNFSTPGAIEGTCRFFANANRGRLVAFAHCYNKLFLCPPADHAGWLAHAKRFVADHPDLSYCRETQHRLKENEGSRYVPRFFGTEMLPFL